MEHILKFGKISKAVLERSVIKRIYSRSDKVIAGPHVGQDAAVISIDSCKMVATSIEPVTIDSTLSVDFAVNKALNNLYAKEAKPIAISVSLLLPVGTKEPYIKAIMSEIDRICVNKNITISGGHTEVTDGVSRVIATISAIGEIDQYNKPKIHNGDDIILTKWIGISGTSILATKKEDELLGWLSPAFVDRAKNCCELVSVENEAKIASENGALLMHDVAHGGICAALWEIAEASNMGLEVNMLDIPVMQETVEICERYDVNPYEMMSDGALLIVAQDGDKIVKALNDFDINAKVIGKLTEGKDRVLINGDERSFIYPSLSDEIYKIL